MKKTIIYFFLTALSILPINADDSKLYLKKWKNGNVVVGLNDASFTIKGLNLKFNPSIQYFPDKVSEIENGYEISYKPEGDSYDERVKDVRATFKKLTNKINVSFDLEIVSTNKVNLSGSMLNRTLSKGIKATSHKKTGYWVRHPYGGMPQEESLGMVSTFSDEKSNTPKFRIAYKGKPNPKWLDGAAQHITFKKISDTHYQSVFDFYIYDESISEEILSADSEDHPFSVDIGTPKTYNWFKNPNDQLSFKYTIANTTESHKTLSINYWVRGYNGEIVTTKTFDKTFEPKEAFSSDVFFKAPTHRGIFYVEVSAIDKETNVEHFDRTNISLLPPHKFNSTPENSHFGIAAYWPHPSEEDIQCLMDRMGVMWIRSGDTTKQHPPRIANHHCNAKLTTLKGEERYNWIRNELQKCVDKKNPYWEFCNEINMSTMGIAMAGGGIGKALMAEPYAEWIRDIKRIQKETNTEHIKLLSFGIAGFDKKFLERIYELGLWESLDEIALHPGRGNFTVDYPILNPEQERSIIDTDGVGANSNFWNFYGAVRGCLSLIDHYGKKPLWLTEVYTPTTPNNFWEDTQRNAAENTFLTYILSKIEGVKAAMYYQMFDSTWFDQLGIRPKDREFFFGLINRDLSLKTCAHAYIACAEILDKANFVGWIKMPNETSRGALFNSPKGQFAVLWDRTDGYVLTDKNQKPYCAPEPWIDTWKTKKEVIFDSSQDSIKLVNCIGQERFINTKDNKVTILLDGAPIVVYGLENLKLY